MAKVLWKLALIGLLAALTTGMPGVAMADATTAVSLDDPIDPYVLLDDAKFLLADGEILKASERLEQIPTENAEGYVQEEVLVQRMLIAASFLNATQFLGVELEKAELADSAYADWLAIERGRYARDFRELAGEYLRITKDGPELDFVRFRLPYVGDDHLRDAELYADEQVLSATVTNWEEGREGLGNGVMLSQARVALTLSAAVHYDLKDASRTIDAVGRRLKAGVPLTQQCWLEWVADTAANMALPGDGLKDLARRYNRRLGELAPGGEQTGSDFRTAKNPGSNKLQGEPSG